MAYIKRNLSITPQEQAVWDAAWERKEKMDELDLQLRALKNAYVTLFVAQMTGQVPADKVDEAEKKLADIQQQIEVLEEML